MSNEPEGVSWSYLFEKNIINIGGLCLKEDGTPDLSDKQTLEDVVKGLGTGARYNSTESGDYIAVGLKIFIVKKEDVAGSILSAYSDVLSFDKAEFFANKNREVLTGFAKKVLREASLCGLMINDTNEFETGAEDSGVYFLIKGNRMFFLNKKNNDVIFSVGRN